MSSALVPIAPPLLLLGLPAWLWRLILLALVLCGGTGLMLYVLLWILVPKEAADGDCGARAFRST